MERSEIIVEGGRGVKAVAEGNSPIKYNIIIFTSILNKSIKGVDKMNILRELESRIENTVGEEQRDWVKKYEEYLSAGIQINLIEKSNDDNSICYMDSEKGEIKYKSYSKEEQEKILIELEALKLKIEKNLN